VADVFRVFDEPRTLDGRAFAPQALTQVGNRRAFRYRSPLEGA
jgi:hypothetical protein